MKYLKVITPTHSAIEIPIERIAENRAKYYVEKYNRSFSQSLDESINAFNDYECLIEYWATRKMKLNEINSIVIEQSKAELNEHDWIHSRKLVVIH